MATRTASNLDPHATPQPPGRPDGSPRSSLTHPPARRDWRGPFKLVVGRESVEGESVEGRVAMTLRMIDTKGVSNHDLAELPDLRKRSDGFLWLDIPQWGDQAEALLADEFKFHQMAISESRNRNHIPRLHVYPHHWFIVVHAPEIGARGHVHYLELDQFVGENFLVTVHGPISPKVPLEAALRETEAVAARLESGRLHATSPFGLTYAIVSSIARREAEIKIRGWGAAVLPWE